MPLTPRGFSTLEIMLAVTIMMTTLSAIVLVELGAPDALADGAKEVAATRLAALLLSASLEEGLSDEKDIVSIASTTSNDVTTSLLVTALPDGITSLLTSSAMWTNVEGKPRFIVLHALMTDFPDAVGNASCSDVLSGNWTHPSERTFTFSSGNLLPASAETLNPISILAVSSTTLVAGTGTTTVKTDPSLFIFDVSSTSPMFLGSVDNATSTKQGVSGVAISGNQVFVANASMSNFSTCKVGTACAQLQVFDISTPAHPTNISNFELPTTSPPFATGSNGQAIGKSIAYANGYVYLGLTKTGSASGEEFNIIDVRNPQAPVWLGGFSVGRSINQIVVRGSYAYLATDDPTRELIVLDVHIPTNITLVGSYDAPGASTFGYGNAVALEGTTIALGRTYTPNGPGLSILSMTSTSPVLVSSEAIASTQNPTNVQALIVRNFLLFVLTNTALEFFDIHTPAQPTQYALSISLPAGSTGSAMACRDNTVYVSSIGNDQTGYLTTFTGS